MKPVAYTSAAIAIVGIVGYFLLRWFLGLPRLQKKNFKARMIPSAYGVYIAFYSALGCIVITKLHFCSFSISGLYIATITGMAALGLLDDVFGTRDAGGFRGHFRKLLLERKLTTGAVKAIGGGIVALAVGSHISRGNEAWVVNSALIALSANALNLVDLRPGRALGVFTVSLFAVLAACGFRTAGMWPIAAILLPTIALARSDVTGRAMMGDTGANLLGASLGLTLAISGSHVSKVAAIALLLAMHICSERYSFTQIIEKNAILKKVDSFLGVR